MRTLMMAAVLALAACGQTAAPASAPSPAPGNGTTVASATTAPEANGCPARATSTWDAGGGNTYSIEATTEGANCAEARATMIIRDAHGALEQNFSLGAADTQVL